ncbi:iron transporter FeoA [Vibrio sp. MACH09]|uniref:FeoA family protein n=1 Tax=unclassified Vibrio TaxID=2614977 RepID=UPI0014934703|nr:MULTISPECIES: FeoA family protein [unclassified Vibrio]NOI65672.1 ferrous iron transport protein A [Vibrio sp. 99-8-1]GLO61435.1 iron transporter FeoA [Vibrio sp. MACH09]
MKLTDLKDGESAKVTAFSGLSSDLKKKLMIMGLLPQTQIRVIRRAPMGDPLQVEVRGVSLALRKNIALEIEVEV